MADIHLMNHQPGVNEAHKSTHVVAIRGVNRVITVEQLTDQFKAYSTIGTGYHGGGHVR